MLKYDAKGNLTETLRLRAGTAAPAIPYTPEAADLMAWTGYGYDANGNLQTLTDPDGYALTYDYDGADRLTGVADGEGRTVVTERDGAGRTVAVTDPNGNTWSRGYWDSSRGGRLKRISEPQLPGYVQSRARELDYDAHGNVVQSTDIPADAGASRISLSRYDALDRVVRQVGPVYTDSDPNSASYNQSIRPVTIQRYSALGYLVEVKAGKTSADGGLNVDANTGTSSSDTVATQVSYGTDDFGRRLSETDALGQTTTWTYDAQNNPKTRVTPNPGGHTLSYVWGYGHQLTSLSTEDGRKIAYSRNPLGQPTRAETWSNATTLLVAYDSSYDAAHRLQTVTDSRGPKALSYDRSPAGRLNWVLDSDGNRTDYRYDGVGRLDGVWTPNYDYIQLSLDDGGRLSQKRYPNGVTATYAWNPDNSLQQVSHALGTTILAQSTYGYDGYGSRNSLSETLSGLPSLSYGYQYDGLNRLIQVDNGTASQRESYGYDPLGNRVQKQIGTPVTATTAYRYDAANQLTEIHQTSLAGTLLEADLYDGSGNRIKQCTGTGVTRPNNTSCTGSSQATQGWNSFGQLSQYAGTITANFEYDDQGRRIGKTESAATSHYLYDGADLHGEYPTPSAMPSAVYTFGEGIDKPLSRITGTTSLPGATARYYHEDGLGSLLATTGQTMTPTPDLTTQRFNAWGSRLAGNGAVPTFGYTGREPDSTGLMYYRARYYDPGIGRFASRDPIGLLGGVNRYAYVGSDPVNWIDSLGLIPCLYCHQPPDWLNLPAYNSEPAQPSSPIPEAEPSEDNPVTGSGTRQWDKTGSYEDALKDFGGKQPTEVVDKGNGVLVGKLPNGDRIILRPTSSNGKPTIEIQRPDGKRSKDKVRYYDEKLPETESQETTNSSQTYGGGGTVGFGSSELDY